MQVELIPWLLWELHWWVTPNTWISLLFNLKKKSHGVFLCCCSFSQNCGGTEYTQKKMWSFMPAVTNTPSKNHNGKDEDWCICYENQLASRKICGSSFLSRLVVHMQLHIYILWGIKRKTLEKPRCPLWTQQAGKLPFIRLIWAWSIFPNIHYKKNNA